MDEKGRQRLRESVTRYFCVCVYAEDSLWKTEEESVRIERFPVFGVLHVLVELVILVQADSDISLTTTSLTCLQTHQEEVGKARTNHKVS
jgi:hypothetical protein